MPGRVQITSWLPAGDHLLFITFIIGLLTTSGNSSTDPLPAPRDPRGAFIIYYVYYFYYPDNDFISLLHSLRAFY